MDARLPPDWARCRPTSSQEARHLLAKHADSLRRSGYSWLARALSAYLKGKVSSLDEALGVIEKGGKKSDPEVLVRDMRVFELAGMFGERKHTWKQIDEIVGMSDGEARKLVAALNKKKVSTRADQNRRKRARAAVLRLRMRGTTEER